MADIRQGLALDIDETLAATNRFWIEHLVRHFGNPAELTHDEIISTYRYAQHVPHWQSSEALQWMEEARNSDEWQEVLPLIPNANHVVEKINAIIPIAAYMTVRPERVIEGTRRWLRRHGFPEAPIFARPAGMEYEAGNKWKAELLHSMYPRVLGLVDDNPAVADHLPPEYQGAVFLYDNISHARSDISVIPCKSWTDVLSAVEERFGRKS